MACDGGTARLSHYVLHAGGTHEVFPRLVLQTPEAEVQECMSAACRTLLMLSTCLGNISARALQEGTKDEILPSLHLLQHSRGDHTEAIQRLHQKELPYCRRLLGSHH